MTASLFKGSKHAELYSRFRPSPPQELVDFIFKYFRKRIDGACKQAVDIGCGSGQSTVVFSPYFEKVTGFDISEAQINSARENRSLPNVEFKAADCLNLPLPNASVQLVTSSQAIHWFNLTQLYAEVKRILVPSGVIAVYGYWIPLPQFQDTKQTKRIACMISEDFHEKQLGKYWNEERYILKSYYSTIDFPFRDTKRLNLVAKTESSLADYIGYLSTWSAYQKLFKEDKKRAEGLLKDVEKELISISKESKTAEEIVFPLHTDFFLLIGHC